MSADDQDTSPPGAQEPELAKILELLERLAAGERLTDAPIAMGLSQDEARSMFAKAGLIVRQTTQAEGLKRWPVKASLLDWRKMTVAEALEILGSLPAPQNTDEG
jgi:hypothetical protein